LDVGDGKGGVGDAVGDECLFERFGGRVGVRFENQLDPVRIVGRDNGEPGVFAIAILLFSWNPSTSV
jgi:hypothetical protein